LIQQGGSYVNDRQVRAFDEKIGTGDIEDGTIRLRKGKKQHVLIRVSEIQSDPA
jgi:tyrosyl-tRNA synthetase